MPRSASDEEVTSDSSWSGPKLREKESCEFDEEGVEGEDSWRGESGSVLGQGAMERGGGGLRGAMKVDGQAMNIILLYYVWLCLYKCFTQWLFTL